MNNSTFTEERQERAGEKLRRREEKREKKEIILTSLLYPLSSSLLRSFLIAGRMLLGRCTLEHQRQL